VTLPDGTVLASDHYFALQMQSAGNVILAAQVSANQETVFPPQMFLVTAWAVGDITAPTDADGVLRRVKAFRDYVVWDELVRRAWRHREAFSYDTNRIRFRGEGGEPIEIPIAPDGTADLSLLETKPAQTPSPSQGHRRRLFTRYRAWNLGLAAAARHLGLDLDQAIIEPGRRIVLKNTNGVERVPRSIAPTACSSTGTCRRPIPV
jgi:hypothetical protein